jgi:hypothetical protein
MTAGIYNLPQIASRAMSNVGKHFIQTVALGQEKAV